MQELLTELDAVNGMLMAIHEQPVSSLDDDGVSDASIALHTLNEVSRAVQGSGWHFNTVRNVKLIPSDPQKELVLPRHCLRVDTVRGSARHNMVQRGLRLFNTTTNTFTFTSPVVVDMVLFLPFEELIQPVRDYIMIRATRRFQARVMGSQVIEHFTGSEEFQAKAILEQAELDNADFNYMTDNPLSWYIISRDRFI